MATTAHPQQHGDWFKRDGECVRVIGDVRPQNRKTLLQLALEALAEHRRCTVDLEHAGYIDSSGIATLIAVAQTAANQGTRLTLANASKEFRELLEKIDATGRSFTFIETQHAR